VRLFLDAHLSGRVLASKLRELGHDVLATDEHPSLQAAGDRDLFDCAASSGRVVVTCDIADFSIILREWAEEGRDHSGCILIAGIGNSEFGVLLRALEKAFERYPRSQDWRNLPLFLPREE
jgi:predicted nuclease of predicted toxin-antitoxin system